MKVRERERGVDKVSIIATINMSCAGLLARVILTIY